MYLHGLFSFFFRPQELIGRLYPNKSFILHESYHPIGRGHILSILNFEKHAEDAKRKEEEGNDPLKNALSHPTWPHDKYKKRRKNRIDTEKRKDHVMYDIYVFLGCKVPPDIEDLMVQVPALADPSLQRGLLRDSFHSGFLGLNLSMNLAARLLRRLKSVGGRGYRLPSAYRQPRISLEQARAIASGVIADGQSLRTNHTLGSLSLLWDRAMHWVFCAPWEPPVTVEGGGMFCVNIDKLDGHIWTPEERNLLVAESYWERER